MAYTDAQLDTLQYVSKATAALSIFGSLGSILAFLFWRRFQTATARLVFFMSIADLMSVISRFIGRWGIMAGTESFLCQFQAGVMQWGDISSILWTAMISLNLVLILYMGLSLDDILKYEKYYVVICYSAGVVMAVVPVFVDSANGNNLYGDAILWCWITSTHPYHQLAFLFIPLWVVFLFNAVIYAWVGRLIWQTAKSVSGTGRSQYKYIYGKNVSLYLAAFIIVWTPGSLNRIYIMATGSSCYAFAIMQAFFSPLRGFINFAAYFYLTWFVQVKEEERRSRSQGNGFQKYSEYSIDIPLTPNFPQDESYRHITLSKGSIC
ncbi:hypothetical protein K493DRAFT_316222 [Basidiobolus meristosporus CBS 931.73]|uniref:G-protein coupled receptors family 2 profile 2 domain-containing protein n=1 Tax=Basidiobolus meristosporus CBS 931.73 TaxID=1314790 RepID=A0A1Y1Y4Y5_9FUNG|nr:hypothetical protein K493DRAFT_316222 [Basidiobolus meristosporus CBS 931.73]|eukprot:ORX93048.1 hypothetical protein K493DRAFT_316222 [Basidiobolus meristosporus CBS 931.73]